MLVELEAEGFRNLEPLQWNCEAGAHLIVGSNGMGKTSLLEAIYLLATTRSFRTPQLAECCRHDREMFSLAGEVEQGGRSRLELSWSRAGSRRRLNGSKSSLAEHLAPLPVVCWTTESSEILSGPPEERRRFLDRGVLGIRPPSIHAFARYRRTLAEKKKLLTGSSGPIEPWNRLLAEAAAEISRLRASYVERLGVAFAEILRECELGLPTVNLDYRPSPSRALDGVDAIEEHLAAQLNRERALGRPLAGPQRDELEIRWSRHRVRRLASAGERKALGLALLAAQGRLLSEQGRSPIYLLDDADTELDPERLTSIWRAFASSGQLLATSNRPRVWRHLSLDHHWICQHGQLRPGLSPEL